MSLAIPASDYEVNVFPIPSSLNTVTVSIRNPVPAQMNLRLFNAMGQLVWHQQASTSAPVELIQINISKLSAGVYLLHIDAGSFKTTRHIIKN
jgi:hypothetical protein